MFTNSLINRQAKLSVQSKLLSKSVLALAIAAAMSATASAAEQLEEVVVTGIRASVQSALEIKRNETRFVDAISVEDIADFPDENIAESIQRIPGVQIRRESGRGALISIRGLGPEFVATTLNGQTFASAQFSGGFRFDIVQSELASSIEVFKSPSAELNEGGLAGTININTAKPLDFDERKIAVSAQGTITTNRSGTAPRGSFTYVDQFNDGTVGVLFNAAYQELDTRFDLVFNQRFVDIDDDGDGVGDIDASGIPVERTNRPRFRRENSDTERKLFNGAIQFRPNDQFEANLVGVLAIDERELEFQQLIPLLGVQQRQGDDAGVLAVTELGRTGSTVDRLLVENFLTETNNTQQFEDRESFAITADATYELNEDWTVDGVLHYTSGELDLQERAIILNRTTDAQIDFSNPGSPIFTPIGGNLADPAFWSPDTGLLTRSDLAGKVDDLDFDETSFELNVERQINSSFFTSVRAGIKFSDQSLDSSSTRFDRQFGAERIGAPFPSIEAGNVTVTDFLDGEFPGLQVDYTLPDIDLFLAALDASDVVVDPNPQASGFFEISRDIFTFYAQANFEAGPLRGNIGLRYADTDRDIQTVQFTPTTISIGGFELASGFGSPVTNSFSYDNWLPSLNVVYDFSENVIGRFSAAKVIVRPGIGNTASFSRNISSEVFGDTTLLTVTEGSFDLPALEANQLDIGLEWYTGEAGAITGGIFYKEVGNRVSTERVCPSDFVLADVSLGANGQCLDSAGVIYDIFRNRVGTEDLDLIGLELGFSQGLTFLPAPWDNLGVQANFTYIDADSPDNQPLLDTSDRSGNFILYYENERFSARVAYNFRSEYSENDGFIDGINFGSSSAIVPNPGRVVQARNQIDLSASYNVTDNFKLTFEAINVNEDKEEGFRFEEQRFQTAGVFGATYFFGARYSF